MKTESMEEKSRHTGGSSGGGGGDNGAKFGVVGVMKPQVEEPEVRMCVV